MNIKNIDLDDDGELNIFFLFTQRIKIKKEDFLLIFGEY